MGSSTFLVVIISVLLFLATLTHSQNVLVLSECNETSGIYTANSTYKDNLNRLISRLSSQTDFNYGFFNLSEGKAPDDVHSIALCRGDVNQDQCNKCLNTTATELERSCPLNKEAIAWSDFCSVRYANRDLYGQLEALPPRTCAYNVENVTNPVLFNQTLSDLLNNLSSTAAAGGPLKKYAAGNLQSTLYAMVQCTPDMDQSNCSACLNFAMSELQNCCYGRKGCRVLRPTCFLRFESNPFFNQTSVALPPSPTSPHTSIGVPLPSPQPPSTPTSPPPTSKGGNENNTTRTVIIVIASVLGVLMII